MRTQFSKSIFLSKNVCHNIRNSGHAKQSHKKIMTGDANLVLEQKMNGKKDNNQQ